MSQNKLLQGILSGSKRSAAAGATNSGQIISGQGSL